MQKPQKTDWFMKNRFGMFIHWGLYSIPARGEWVRSNETMSIEEYQKYFDAFDPIDYRPREWARLAKKAGMKYAVLTVKHHDGFCLFDSALTDYKATNTKAGRDLVREYVDAFRAEGLKVGFYYSLLDWHHPDYPTYCDMFHPMRNCEAFRDVPQDFQRYIDYFHGQVRELLTNYGKIDIMWFDFSYKDANNDMCGEKWKPAELLKIMGQLQPELIVNNRLSSAGSFGMTDLTHGDFSAPEQFLPREGLADDGGSPIPWEACVTLNNNWGYCAADHDYKQSRDVIRALVECVSKNGNFMLNVGPDARGNIPRESVAILEKVGAWVNVNANSIYGCGATDLSKPEWGRYTQNGNRLYAHIYDRGIGPLLLEKLAGKILSARLLCDHSEVAMQKRGLSCDSETDAFLDLKTSSLPCGDDTVVELQLERGSAPLPKKL